MKKAVVIDCYSILHNLRYRLKYLAERERHIGVVFGFLQKLLKYSKQFETDKFIFCWDSKQRLRQVYCNTYKVNREKLIKQQTKEEEELRRIAYLQFDQLRKEVIPKMGFRNSFISIGLEADDLVAEIVNNKKSTFEYVVVTSDGDLLQLLSDRTSIFMLGKDKLLTKKWFEKTYGLEPIRWAEAKAVGGCNGDNVIGVKGMSDPAKSKVSNTLAYLRGELKPGILTKRIENSQELIKRNRKLVYLPYQNIEIKLKKDVLTKEAFFKTFKMLGINYFLKVDVFAKWKEAFKL